MLWRLCVAERRKMKHSPVWLAFLLMPVVPAFLGTVNYLNNLEILQEKWYSLWTQNTLFTCYFFLPVLLGVYCGYLMRLEKNNRNLMKLLSLPISRKGLFLAKVAEAGKMIALSEIWIGILFLISGKAAGITEEPPLGELFIWCAFGALGGMVMAAMQLVISLLSDSFALSVGIAFAGGLSGLAMLSKKLGHLYPYSLMAYGMSSNNSQQQITKSAYPQFVLVCMLYLILFTGIGAALMEKKEM